MKTVLRKIEGPWDDGWVLDKHMVKSTYLGDDENGHPRFESIRTEVGEATYRLKYKGDWAQSAILAGAVAESIFPKFESVGLIVPMPATNKRSRQPVNDVAKELGKIVGLGVFENLLLKAENGKSLKNLHNKDDKLTAIGESLSIKDEIGSEGRWNVLLLDDLFDSGASMEAACKALRGYRKILKIYVVALTWK